MPRRKAFELAMSIIQAEELVRALPQVEAKQVEKSVIVEKRFKYEPKGVVLPLTVNVTSQFTDVVGDEPWWSAYINNEGPNPIYASVGIMQKGRSIPVAWHWEMKFDLPVIKHLYLVCDTNLTATATVDGAY
jgi:hypothetical protein